MLFMVELSHAQSDEVFCELSLEDIPSCPAIQLQVPVYLYIIQMHKYFRREEKEHHNQLKCYGELQADSNTG